MVSAEAIKRRVEKLESSNVQDDEIYVPEIYLVGVTPAGENGEPEKRNSALLWRDQKTYKMVFAHHGKGNAEDGYELFKQAADMELPDTWQEYAKSIHQPTIDLFTQFLKPVMEKDPNS